MERDISPPPTKRRKLVVPHSNTPGTPGEIDSGADMGARTRCIRIFSWNINGIQPFLPPSNLPITSFFKPASQQKTRARDGSQPASALSPSHSQPRDSSFSSPLRAFLARHHWPEVLFLQELKISPADQKTPAALLSAVNTPSGPEDLVSPGTTYTLDVNRPRDRYNAKGFGGKLYGVGTLLRSDFASQHVLRIRHAEWDLEGRVSIVELRRPPGGKDDDVHKNDGRQHSPAPLLALVNVYAVNGTSAPYRSPQTGAPAGTRHDHKLAFHSRLRDEGLALEAQGFHVVIAGDLNVARGLLDGYPGLRTWPGQHSVNRADFNTKFFGDEDNKRADAYFNRRDVSTRVSGQDEEHEESFDGVDVFRALYGRDRRYTYHPRRDGEWGSSCDRVDMIIVSRSMRDAGRVVDTGILDTPQERGTSDHVPLWATVKLTENVDIGPAQVLEFQANKSR